MSTDEPQALTQAELRDAEQILADLNDLSSRLSKSAPNNPAFFAVNRAWRSVGEACSELKKAMP